MALTITTTITVADDEAYTAREQAILAAIAAHPSNGTAAPAAAPVAAPTEKIPAGVAADARIAEAKAEAAAAAKAKTAAAAKAKAAADAKAAAEAAAEEPAEVDNDAEALAAMEADLAGDAPTLEDAVTKATTLIGDGKAAQVKAALLAAGVKRVSELKGDGISTFLTALAG